MLTFPNQNSQFLPQRASFEQWQAQVEKHRQIFNQHPAYAWLLFEQDCFTFSIIFFALIAANKKVILPQNGQAMQIKQCMQYADIFVGSEIFANINQFKLTPITNNDIGLDGTISTCKQQLQLNPENPIIFFTSGSSGAAKAINKTFGQLITEIEILEETFAQQLIKPNFEQQGQPKDPIFMATVNHQHIYGLLFKLLWPLWTGRTFYSKTFEYPEHLVHQIKQQPLSTICLISSPAYYHRLIKDNVFIPIKSQFKALFSSGGPLDADAAIKLNSQLDIIPIEVFGSTETGGIAWRQKKSVNDELWQAFNKIECRYVQTANTDSEKTQQLEILSPYINPAVWYQTDDRVELTDKQRFKLLGRADRIVKIEEKRCSLDEIQNYLREHIWIDQAYVMTIGGKDQQRLCLAAIVVLNTDGNQALTKMAKFQFDRKLKNFLKNYVEALVIPRKFRYLESLPHNSQGKLNKLQLEALFD